MTTVRDRTRSTARLYQSREEQRIELLVKGNPIDLRSSSGSARSENPSRAHDQIGIPCPHPEINTEALGDVVL